MVMRPPCVPDAGSERQAIAHGGRPGRRARRRSSVRRRRPVGIGGHVGAMPEKMTTGIGAPRGCRKSGSRSRPEAVAERDIEHRQIEMMVASTLPRARRWNSPTRRRRSAERACAPDRRTSRSSSTCRMRGRPFAPRATARSRTCDQALGVDRLVPASRARRGRRALRRRVRARVARKRPRSACRDSFGLFAQQRGSGRCRRCPAARRSTRAPHSALPRRARCASSAVVGEIGRETDRRAAARITAMPRPGRPRRAECECRRRLAVPYRFRGRSICPSQADRHERSLPPPGASSNPTVPPSRVTICLTMLSPRPVPPFCRASVASAWANFSKMRGLKSPGMPGP